MDARRGRFLSRFGSGVMLGGKRQDLTPAPGPGIKRQRIDPGSPWQNGRIERLFGTLKPLLRQLTIPTASALQARLNELTTFYNHVRVHQGLDGLTPAEAWSGQDLNAVRRRYGQGQWLQALDGLMLGYWLRC